MCDGDVWCELEHELKRVDGYCRRQRTTKPPTWATMRRLTVNGWQKKRKTVKIIPKIDNEWATKCHKIVIMGVGARTYAIRRRIFMIADSNERTLANETNGAIELSLMALSSNDLRTCKKWLISSSACKTVRNTAKSTKRKQEEQRIMSTYSTCASYTSSNFPFPFGDIY